jgi:hypothetical protein
MRARITATDLSRAGENVSSAEGIEEIAGLVRAWLERFSAASRSEP